MKSSESIIELSKALNACQPKIENASKNAVNPHFKKTYADLGGILAEIKPIIAEAGLSFMQHPGMDNGLATVETIVMHTSGEWISSVAATPIVKTDPQGIGAAITYLRRYSLSAIFGLTQEDDDGNSHRNDSPKTATGYTLDQNAQGWISAAQKDPEVLNQIADPGYREFIKSKL